MSSDKGKSVEQLDMELLARLTPTELFDFVRMNPAQYPYIMYLLKKLQIALLDKAYNITDDIMDGDYSEANEVLSKFRLK
jgi:hypothetical protein